MSFFKTLLNMVCKKGISISYSDGPAFNPAFQERTDPIDDIIKSKQKNKESGNNELVSKNNTKN